MSKTIQEILEQPYIWEKTLQAFKQQNSEINGYLKKHQMSKVLLTGCGTSYYLSLTASSLFTQLTGKASLGVPAAEIMLFPKSTMEEDKNYLLISISRSGKTLETLSAARYVKDVRKGEVILVTCSAKSEIADLANLFFICPDAAEETKYMTKSFTSMLLSLQLFISSLTNNTLMNDELGQLPRLGQKLIDRYQTRLQELANDNDFNFYIYLGHGPLYGIASEAMLKIKEMACTPAEAYHGMEFMHGPKYAVNEKTLITYFLSSNYEVQVQEIELLKRIKTLGTSILIICEESKQEIDEIADFVFELKSGLSENATPILMMLIAQLYGYYRAVALGKDIE